jgi:hypothetical protein
MTRAGWLLGVALATAFSVSAAPPQVRVELDRSEVELGDRVVLTWTAELPAGASVSIESLVTPAPAGEAPPGGHVLEFETPGPERWDKPAAGADGPVRWSRSVAFSPFVSGALTIPGAHLVVTLPGGQRAEVRPPAASLLVRSRLPEGQEPDKLPAKDDRPARIPSLGPWFWGSLASAAVILSLLAVWLWRRRRGRGTGESVAAEAPALPPAEELARTLDELARRIETLSKDPRPFYTDLTHATKRYLERRLSQPVLEWTSFETVRRLREQSLEPPRDVGLPELLSGADFVKFGRGSSTRPEANAHLERVRKLSRWLEDRLAPLPNAAKDAADREKAS